jgi:hypothetical protein
MKYFRAISHVRTEWIFYISENISLFIMSMHKDGITLIQLIWCVRNMFYVV